jgi:uncharacterized alpha-E superfamily protein
MLSRLAESLFWLGRYIERADDTARMVDTYVHRMVEDPRNDERATCQSLLAILGVEVPPSAARLEPTLQSVVFDQENPNSIAGSLNAAYDNARRSRDVISSEVWVALNATRLELPAREGEARAKGPATYLAYVRERCALLAGVADATMSHDEGWHYLVLGRTLERIDMVARLLRGRVVNERVAPDWVAFLRAAGAMEAFMRSGFDVHDSTGVAGFLLLDRSFPRSALFGLLRADECLVEITPGGQRATAGDSARHALHRARTTLEYLTPEDVGDQLGELLTMLEITCTRVTDAVTDRYFRHDDPVAWNWEGAL